MMLKIPQIFKLFPFLLLLILGSCVKDVDLNQTDEIVIPPNAAVDLVYATLDPSHFLDKSGSPVQRISDTTRLDFLDDDYIKKSLMRAEFSFKYTNTFSQAFTSTIYFLSENDVVQHSFVIEIPEGSATEPRVVDVVEIIEQSNIGVIRKSIKLSIQVEMHPNGTAVNGTLKLKSKGFFNFEFR